MLINMMITKVIIVAVSTVLVAVGIAGYYDALPLPADGGQLPAQGTPSGQGAPGPAGWGQAGDAGGGEHADDLAEAPNEKPDGEPAPADPGAAGADPPSADDPGTVPDPVQQGSPAGGPTGTQYGSSGTQYGSSGDGTFTCEDTEENANTLTPEQALECLKGRDYVYWHGPYPPSGSGTGFDVPPPAYAAPAD